MGEECSLEFTPKVKLNIIQKKKDENFNKNC